jgi:hypothetical protein
MESVSDSDLCLLSLPIPRQPPSAVKFYRIMQVEPLLSGLMTGCRWPDNQKSRIIEDDPKTTC